MDGQTVTLSADVFILTRDLELGLARRPCSYCGAPLMIRLPSMRDAVRDQDSHALRLGLHTLTGQERAMFDAVYTAYPQAVSRSIVLGLLQISGSNLNNLTSRIRKKIGPAGWRLITGHAALRLLEPVPPQSLRQTQQT